MTIKESIVITKPCKNTEGMVSASTANGLLVIILLPFKNLINFDVSNIVKMIDQPLYGLHFYPFKNTTYTLRL
tara:strand:+ start:694 stop:912 length:219 start_codon:yes stop_codon:yes gene_type:complete